ncbi:hypothetical protein BGW39_004526 [Mortierella sp. 14UC]|nr:hypothetical protein BGW39_004526 [Mortierella sp. 14UC]
MDPLSRLPLECLQRILHTIAVDRTGACFAVLTKLARVNRYIYMVTLPFLYRNPFIFYPYKTGERAWTLYRTLLASVPRTNLHPALLLEFKLDESTAARPNPPLLDHLRHLLIEPNAFRECILQGHGAVLVGEKMSDLLELLQRLPSPYVQFVQSKEDLLRLCHSAVVFRELNWSLASPILEQLETLSIPVSDIHRYFNIIDRLSRLEQIYFVMDEVYEWSTETDSPSTKSVREEAAMQNMVRFVEQHTRLFKARLKDAKGLESQRWPHVRNNISMSALQKIFRLLPPLYKPSSISNSNWDRFMEHPLTTDLSEVQNVSGVRKEQWHHAIREDLQVLQRCRSLKHLNTLSIGRRSFAWAVEEKKISLRMLGSESVDSSEGGKESPPATPQLDLVPLESIVMVGYHSLTDEVDDVAYAFSQTLRRLVVLADDDQGQFSTIHFGRGWVDLPELTELDLHSRHRHRLVLDPALLTLCPSLSRINIGDGTTEYQCQDIEPCLPAYLPNLQSLVLQGWSALTFHPATLHSTAILKDLQVSLSYLILSRCFIPPIEELKQSFGISEGGAEVETATLGPVRPLWTWDWHLPMLLNLRLHGEFAFLFEFRMLAGCPALETLYLNIHPIQGEFTRVLTLADFFLPTIDTTTTATATNSEQERPSAKRCGKRGDGPTPIVAKRLKSLYLNGHWVVDDTLLPHLLDGMFPRLNAVTMAESSGFSLRCLVDFVKTKVKHINLVKLGLPQPSEEEGVELGLYLRKGLKKDMKVTFPYQWFFQGTEYLLLRNPSVLAERRKI